MQEYVAGFLFDDSKKFVALIEKQKPDWQAGLWNAIGGKVETNEDPYDAMSREFAEETGLAVEEWDLFCTLSGVDWTVWFYRSFVPMVSLNQARTMEEERVGVFDVNILPSTIPNLRWLIPLAKYTTHDRLYPISILERESQ